MFASKGSSLVVLHVEADAIPPEVTQYIPKKTINEWYADQGKKAAKAAVTKLDAAGIKYKLIQKVGRVADTILDEAKASKSDMIVMGSHGHGSLMSLVMGSITTQVVSQAKQPVLIIK
jgi:nucleotide-binding universal stress UspA family protein